MMPRSMLKKQKSSTAQKADYIMEVAQFNGEINLQVKMPPL
jgi:hypothetical protein